MKVHSVDINYIKQNRYKTNKKEYDLDTGSVLSSDVIFNYLNITANYNPVFSGSKRDFYAIDKDGNYQKFSDRKAAESTLSLSVTNIAACLQGKRKVTHCYGFVYADEIETINENGETVVDEIKLNNKIQQITTALETQDKPVPIYAIDKSGNCTKYSSKSQAQKTLGICASHIIKCLNKQLKKIGGYAFVFPEEIETTDEKGNTIIDKSKIDEIVFSILEENSIPVYAINKNGKYKKYSGIKKAARELDLDPSHILKCLNGGQKRIGEYTFVLAEKIETTDESGNIVINHEVLKEKYDEVNKTAVYAIYKDGHYKKYITQAEAAKELGLSSKKILNCINGISTKVSDYAFVRACDVESFDNGVLKINETLLKKFALEPPDIVVNAVYAFDSEGNYQRLDSVSQSAQILHISKSGIKQCLSGHKKSSCGYRFIYAREIENNVDGETIVDYDKLDEISEEINPSIKKRMKKFGKIYVIKDVDIMEFDNIRKAARTLGIDENLIIYFLENGRNPEDGKNSIDGYVFTTEKDK